MHLSLIAAGIGTGDEVITTPLTFCATINTIIHAGATPVLVDIDPHTQLIDTRLIEAKITAKTRAIIPVHLYGRPCAMEQIDDLSKKYNLVVIEDAAHALEAKIGQQKIGSISDFTCFSFYVTKNICTGEGGLVTTNNPEFAEKIDAYRLHGLSRHAWKRYSNSNFQHYQVLYPGYKYNMMDIQAAIGIHQIKHIDDWLIKRNEIWRRYNEAFQDLPVVIPAKDKSEIVHARHLYTLLVDENRSSLSRNHFIAMMQQQNIGVGIHYQSLHTQPYYVDTYGFAENDFPNSYWVGESTVSLPLSPKLTERDIERVISSVRSILI